MSHDHHHRPLFSEVSSCLEKEFLNADITVIDDAATAAARKAAEEEPTDENLLTLAAKLSFQQRHSESAEICRLLTARSPKLYAAHRRLGLNCLKTLRHKEAYDEFLWCLERSDDLLDLHYRLGLSLYYQGKYSEAWYWFPGCFKLCEDNDEMYVAVLYWTILTLKKLGRNDWADFIRPADPGHHRGYDIFLKFALGKLSKSEADEAIPTLDTLSRTCAYYGMYVWFEREAPEEAAAYMNRMLECSELWGSFSFIAGYTEYLGNRS